MPPRPDTRRGESSADVSVSATPQLSAGVAGIAAALAPGQGLGPAGRVTKARYEPLEGDKVQALWGVVHLYRDGDEAALSGAAATNPKATAAGTTTDRQKKTDAEGDMAKESIGWDDHTTLCIPSIPSYIMPSDLLGFVGDKTREQVSHFRMIMTEKASRYLVLMKFIDGEVARKWRAEWDGKVFNSIEPETCNVRFVKSITVQTPNAFPQNTSFPELSHDPFTPALTLSRSALEPFPPTPASLLELPTCPVCLERMDDKTGLLTILCQHVFHCACLQKWRGSGCPVCRHTNHSLALSSRPRPSITEGDPTNLPFGSGTASLCSICDTASDLWICLICGNVGCGRYKGGHAKSHWHESAHNFALEIETQYVWDYAGDVWVHRLIRDKGEGKEADMSQSKGRDEETREEGPTKDGAELAAQEKLEGVGMEYTQLLSSQLESQRVFFEDLLAKAMTTSNAATTAASAATTQAEAATSALAALQLEHTTLQTTTLPSLERDAAREKKRADKATELARRLTTSLTEEKKVGEGLLARIGHVNAALAAAESRLEEAHSNVTDLQDMNRDLLFALSAADRLKALDEAALLDPDELEGSLLILPPAAKKERERSRGKGRDKGKGKERARDAEGEK